MQIKDLILETKKVNWHNLQDLQPNNLKLPYNNDKTKASLIKNGFASAFQVWQDKDGEIWIIDGHLRKDLLLELESDGYAIPPLLSCTFIDLPNKKTAVRYLLEVFNTKKNPTDGSVAVDWVIEEGLDKDDVAFDWVDSVAGAKTDQEVDFDNIKSNADRQKQIKKITTTCPSCEHSFEIQV